MARHTDLVRYCPGTAGGSPGLVSSEQADVLLVRDTRLLRLLVGVGGAPDKVIFPHVGGYCAACKPRSESNVNPG